MIRGQEDRRNYYGYIEMALDLKFDIFVVNFYFGQIIIMMIIIDDNNYFVD